MNVKRGLRFTTPSVFDERIQILQLLVIRDAFVALLLLSVLFVFGLAWFRSFVLANLSSIGVLTIIIVGLVAWISNALRNGGVREEHKPLFARGDILAAPVLAAIAMLLESRFFAGQISLSAWLLLYGANLIGFLAYPLFVLLRERKRAEWNRE